MTRQTGETGPFPSTPPSRHLDGQRALAETGTSPDAARVVVSAACRHRCMTRRFASGAVDPGGRTEMIRQLRSLAQAALALAMAMALALALVALESGVAVAAWRNP